MTVEINYSNIHHLINLLNLSWLSSLYINIVTVLVIATITIRKVLTGFRLFSVEFFHDEVAMQVNFNF